VIGPNPCGLPPKGIVAAGIVKPMDLTRFRCVKPQQSNSKPKANLNVILFNRWALLPDRAPELHAVAACLGEALAQRFAEKRPPAARQGDVFRPATVIMKITTASGSYLAVCVCQRRTRRRNRGGRSIWQPLR